MLIQFLKPDFEYMDERGKLVQLVHDGWKQVNVTESKAGEVRGNHYHKVNREAFYVVKGEFDLRLEKNGETENYHLTTGQMFQIEPYVVHTFEFKMDSILLGLYDMGVENVGSEKDIYKNIE